MPHLRAGQLLLISFLVLPIFILSGCKAIGTQRSAALQVTSTPQASVFLDGKHLGKTPFSSNQLKEGEYTLKISISEASYIEKVKLLGGTLTVVDRELSNNFMAQSGTILSLNPERKGFLIISAPREADVTVDGKLVGKTPIEILDVLAGDHKILVTEEGYKDLEFSVKTSRENQLIADVTLAAEIAKSPPQTIKPTVPKVEIGQTPQGFLRVRNEPSLNSLEVGRVKTGDVLEIVQEVQEFYKISFEGKQGWISKDYAKKI